MTELITAFLVKAVLKLLYESWRKVCLCQLVPPPGSGTPLARPKPDAVATPAPSWGRKFRSYCTEGKPIVPRCLEGKVSWHMYVSSRASYKGFGTALIRRIVINSLAKQHHILSTLYPILNPSNISRIHRIPVTGTKPVRSSLLYCGLTKYCLALQLVHYFMG